ncbi:hypothetical protein C8F04DRAFT_1269746 [Mycena alexandri]|uniref:Uncharacterized protein n=1 Tax=Mycena alexandri TaxID=1745969 RepID=A0AAD6SE14_9AGAR|nr:hypothetical protein C8F04DRAFT_1269746 [Mycena alexandri]
MPPGVVSMAEALANVNPDALHSTQTGYVLPEPALFVTSTLQRQRMFLHHWKLLADGFLYMLGQEPQLLRPQDWRAVLEGKMSGYGRTAGLQELIRPALALCDIQTIQGLPVPVDALPQFSLRATQEIIWEVADTSFRFEFCALDKRASGKQWVAAGWAAMALDERHRYVLRTAALMLDWTTHCTRSNTIHRVADRCPWPPSEMQALETAVCEYYTTAFYEYFGRAAVIPMRLDHDAEMEDMEDGEI